MSPLGLVPWTPCGLGTGWPNEHLAFGNCLQIGMLHQVFYWRTDIFARMLICLLCSESCLPLLLPCGEALLGQQGGEALETIESECPLGQVLRVPKIHISPGKLALSPLTPGLPWWPPSSFAIPRRYEEVSPCGLEAAVGQTMSLDGAWPSFPFFALPL